MFFKTKKSEEYFVKHDLLYQSTEEFQVPVYIITFTITMYDGCTHPYIAERNGYILIRVSNRDEYSLFGPIKRQEGDVRKDHLQYDDIKDDSTRKRRDDLFTPDKLIQREGGIVHITPDLFIKWSDIKQFDRKIETKYITVEQKTYIVTKPKEPNV